MQGRLQDRVAVVTGAGSGIGLATVRRFAAEGARVVCVDIDAAAGTKAAEEVRRRVRGHRRGRRVGGTRPVRRGGRPARPGGHRVQQRRHLTARRRLHPGHRPGRVGAGAAGQHHERLPVLQVRHSAHAAAGQGLDHQHGLVRGADGCGHVADRVHREQGRGAGDDPGAGCAVRPRGHPGQRALPRPGGHPVAAGAVRRRPGAGRPPAGARADGPLRRNRRRSPPRWRSWPATTPRS